MEGPIICPMECSVHQFPFIIGKPVEKGDSKGGILDNVGPGGNLWVVESIIEEDIEAIVYILFYPPEVWITTRIKRE